MNCQPLKIVSQYCLKIILYASLNLEEATLNKTKQSISHQSSFILTSFHKSVIMRYILSTRSFKEKCYTRSFNETYFEYRILIIYLFDEKRFLEPFCATSTTEELRFCP